MSVRPLPDSRPWAYRVDLGTLEGVVYGLDRDAALEAVLADVVERTSSTLAPSVVELHALDLDDDRDRALYQAELRRLREARG